MSVPDIRIQVLNASSVNGAGDFVLYWMIAYRRVRRNFALQRAVKWAHELNKPLVILEALRSGYPWASDRLHRFVLDGMADNARLLESKPVSYYPYVEPVLDVGKACAPLAGQRAERCTFVTCFADSPWRSLQVQAREVPQARHDMRDSESPREPRRAGWDSNPRLPP